MNNRFEINTYNKPSFLIYDNNSKDNFLNYKKNIEIDNDIDFNFELINLFIENYISISKETGIKEDCLFLPFKKEKFYLTSFNKKLYYPHFYNKKNSLYVKQDIQVVYSRIGFKFISLKIDSKYIPFIMVSFNYLPKSEGLYLISISEEYQKILKVNRSNIKYLEKIEKIDIEKHLYTEFNKIFYNISKKVIKENKIKRIEFINYPLEKTIQYLNLSCLLDY